MSSGAVATQSGDSVPRTSVAGWLLIAAVLATRLALAAINHDPLVVGDGAHYDALARSVANGTGFAFPASMQYPWEVTPDSLIKATARRPPGYPFSLAALYRVGLPPRAMLFIQALLAAVAAWATYRMAVRMRLPELAALAAVAAYLTHVYLAQSGLLLASEPLFIALLTLGVLALMRGLDRGRWPDFAWSGALIGLATLTRPTTLWLPVALLPFLVWPARRAPRGWAVLALAFALAMSPWVIRNAIVFHRFEPTITIRGLTLFAGTYPPTKASPALVEALQPREILDAIQGLDEFGVDSVFAAAARENLRRYPREIAAMMVAKAIRCWFVTETEINMYRPTWKSAVVNAPLLLSGLVGFIALYRRRNPYLWLPLLMIAYFTAAQLAATSMLRYNLPVFPELFLGVGAAVALVAERVRRVNHHA